MKQVGVQNTNGRKQGKRPCHNHGLQEEGFGSWTCLEISQGNSPREMRGPGDLIDFQGLHLPLSRIARSALQTKGDRRPAGMNKLLLTKTQHNKEVYKGEKTGVRQPMRNKDTVQLCRDEITKAKDHRDLSLKNYMKGNKKS